MGGCCALFIEFINACLWDKSDASVLRDMRVWGMLVGGSTETINHLQLFNLESSVKLVQ